jgi:PiT family inorganic phosphate transporter
MDSTFWLVALIIFLALAFDYTNGFHDAANSIATVVSTRVLSPGKAVLLAAFFNFIAIFGGVGVAKTVYKGLVDLGQVTLWVVLAGLVGAISWNLITWYFGLPTSSSHALVGAYAGAAIAKAGWGVLIWQAWPKGWAGTLSAIVMSPTLGMILGITLMVIVAWLFRSFAPSRVDRIFRWGQLLSASLFSFSHGGNDAQKTIGIIWMLLIAAGISGANDPVPMWVIVSCYVAIAMGTLLGGWRIVKTMGQKITKLKPHGGFCAEAGGAMTLFTAAGLGIPVSTTHTITGAIIGVGAARKFNAVRWGVAGGIVWAWIFTIPASAFIAAVTWYGAQLSLK